MIYKLIFLKQALKEWENLSGDIQTQFKTKLVKTIENPHAPECKIRDMKDCYKIKLLSVGYRLVYKVIDERIVVQVISIGKRDKNFAHKLALKSF